jgi:hypothetical protein
MPDYRQGNIFTILREENFYVSSFCCKWLCVHMRIHIMADPVFQDLGMSGKGC